MKISFFLKECAQKQECKIRDDLNNINSRPLLHQRRSHREEQYLDGEEQYIDGEGQYIDGEGQYIDGEG